MVFYICSFTTSHQSQKRTISLFDKKKEKYPNKKITIISLENVLARNDFKYECHAAPHDNECLI